jgi:hypothetical protein
METGAPSIVISKNGVFFSPNLYRKLNEAKFVQVFLAKATKEIAIAACSKDDEGAVDVKLADTYARIYNKDFVNDIATLMGTTYQEINMRVMGKAEDDYYVFDLKAASPTRKKKQPSIE